MNVTTRLTTLVSLVALSGSIAFAQQTPPPAQAPAPDPHFQPGRPGGPGSPAMGPGGMIARGHREGGGPEGGGEGMRGGMRGEGRIVPHGMWWKNPDVATRIGLTPDQVKHMDDIFQSSRLQLIDLKANVEKQSVVLEPMLDANPLDTKRVMAQISRVADARAELEKANAGMLLGIRGVLTPDQWTKLHAGERGGPRHGGMSHLDMPEMPAGAMMEPQAPTE
jgi:Spy/CpxP family protein refolding chaperone